MRNEFILFVAMVLGSHFISMEANVLPAHRVNTVNLLLTARSLLQINDMDLIAEALPELLWLSFD